MDNTTAPQPEKNEPLPAPPSPVPPSMPPPASPQPPQAAPAAEAAEPGEKATVERMREALMDVYDPEIPINIVDLGLLYKIEEHDGTVDIQLTLTSPYCPLGDMFRSQVADVVGRLPGVKTVNVALIFDPPWSKDKMTAEGKLQASMLGFM